MTHYIESDEHIKRIVSATFPDYNGKHFRLSVSDAGIDCRSYWEGGSRSFFRFVNLATLECSAAIPAQSMYDKGIQGLESVLLPEGFACIEHSISCGKDRGIIIHIKPENAAKLIPVSPELTRDERIVLVATRMLKSSYQGISNYRFTEARANTGITVDRWCAALASLHSKKLVNAVGALTVAGRNAAGSQDFYQFKPNGGIR